MAKEDKNAVDNRTKNIKNAQDRKDYAIAFYNATNNAIEMVKAGGSLDLGKDIAKHNIVQWRDWFLEQHAEYRAKVTDQIGATYNTGTAIEKMEATNTKEELQKVWISFTQDERQDPEIHAKCQQLIEKYETIQ